MRIAEMLARNRFQGFSCLLPNKSIVEKSIQRQEIRLDYSVEFKPQAIKDLKKLSSEDQSRVVAKIEMMQSNLAGDVKKLTNFTPEYRLRVGNYCVLFEIVQDRIIVYRVKHSRDVYK